MARYNTLASHFRTLFGGRAQKLSIDAGFSCPNRDGTLATKGCSLCNTDAFTPSYLRRTPSITQQIEEGIAFHANRYHSPAAYLAYFQAYSNTHAPLETLRSRYEEALAHPAIRGLIVGTRPDCVDPHKLDYLASLAQEHYVAVEYGLESIHDTTLRRICRHHTMACSEAAIRATARRGIPVGAHLILVLPGEGQEEMLSYADARNRLPLTSVKFHQLQILANTPLARDYAAHPEQFPPIELDAYVSLVCDLVERLRPDLIIERFASEVPPRHQAAPERAWRRPDGRHLRNEELPQLVESELARRNTRQGSRYYTTNGAAPCSFPSDN